MNGHMTGYRCIACATEQAVDFDGFLCPACGGNLDVTYDYPAAAKAIGGAFAGRRDLFRYRALLPLQTVARPFPLRIGGTPLYRAPRLGDAAGLERLWLKDETVNPSASLKDRASAVAVLRAIEAGAGAVATASTGNAGSSLACMAAALGLRAFVFVPEDAPPAKLTQLLSYGARVLAVRGGYDHAYDLCLEACREFGWFNRSTGFNPFTREGKKTCAFEIWEDLGRRAPDRVVVPSGDGNILSSVWKGFRDLGSVGLIDHLPRIDCVQSAKSAAITRTIQQVQSEQLPPHRGSRPCRRTEGRRPGALTGSRATDQGQVEWRTLRMQEVQATTIADSISVNRPRDGLAAVRAVIESGGEAVTLTDDEILAAIPEMARLTGIFPEPAAAAPWAAVKTLAREGTMEPGETVVCLVTGSGLKDAAGAARAVGRPQVIDPTLDAVKSTM